MAKGASEKKAKGRGVKSGRRKPAPRRSAPTGLYWPCPALGVLHPGKRYAIPIKRGERCHWAKCICNSVTYWPDPDFHDGCGMTEAEAEAQGYTCLG